LGLWGGLIITWLVLNGSWALKIDSQFTSQKRVILLALPVVFFVSQIIRAVLRQNMIGKLLVKDRDKMRTAYAADILCSCLWSLLLMFFILSSAFRREVCWRGIRYKLLGPTETVVLNSTS
jgi:hypothetical protein